MLGMRAGVPLRDMVAAVSAGYLASTPLLDMNHNEASARGCCEVALSMHPGLAKVVTLQVPAAPRPLLLLYTTCCNYEVDCQPCQTVTFKRHYCSA
jgi:hypothetical protein